MPDLGDLVALVGDLVRPIGWRGASPKAEDLDGAVVFPKERRVESFDGTEIAYTVLGNRGPWVALCPGFSCPDSFWRYLGPNLARDHRVIVWDIRGLGLSGTPRAPGYRTRNLTVEDFSLPAIARDLLAVLDDAGADRAALVGHSMGGQTILEAYREYADRITALAFLTAPYESPMRTFYGRNITVLSHAIDRAFQLIPRPAIVLWRLMLLANPEVPHALAKFGRALGPDARVEDMAPYYRHMGLLDPLVMLKMAEAMRAHSAEDVLPTVKVPTLVVAADLDTFSPPGLATIMKEEIPHSELVTIEGAGHGAVIEKPDEVNAAVRSFLERHLGQATIRRASSRSSGRRSG